MIEDLTAFIIDVVVFAVGLAIAMALAPLALVVAGPGLGVIFLFHYVRSVLRGLVPATFAGGSAAIVAPAAGEEPALRQYFFAQAFVDYRGIAIAAWRDCGTVARGKWVLGLARWLLTGKSANPPRPTLPRLARVLLAAPAAVVVLALCTAAALSGALVGLLALAHLLVLAAAALVGLAGMAVFGVLERVGQTVRTRRMACPHPPCYAPIALPTYECPNTSCHHRHHRLQPGRRGVLRHTCLCGQTIPTVMTLGRNRLDAYCPRPNCEKQLPDRIGTARATHVPIVGGPSAGKTMLLMAMMAELEARAFRGEVTFAFASESDRQDFESAKDRLRQGLDVVKTVVTMPRAFLFYLGAPGGRRRLVYVYDPAGEFYEDTAGVQQQGYLAHASALVLVADPFAVADFVSVLGPDDRQVVADARPSPEDPTATFARMTQSLRVMAVSGLKGTPVAVVVPKLDALGKIRSSPVPAAGATSDELQSWLRSIGLDNLVRGLDLEFGEVAYFATSARMAAADADAGAAVVQPLQWLLERCGLELGATAGKRG